MKNVLKFKPITGHSISSKQKVEEEGYEGEKTQFDQHNINISSAINNNNKN